MLAAYFRVCKLWVLPLKHTFDTMFASQQGLWSSKFVPDVSRKYTDN